MEYPISTYQTVLHNVHDTMSPQPKIQLTLPNWGPHINERGSKRFAAERILTKILNTCYGMVI